MIDSGERQVTANMKVQDAKWMKTRGCMEGSSVSSWIHLGLALPGKLQ